MMLAISLFDNLWLTTDGL